MVDAPGTRLDEGKNVLLLPEHVTKDRKKKVVDCYYPPCVEQNTTWLRAVASRLNSLVHPFVNFFLLVWAPGSSAC